MPPCASEASSKTLLDLEINFGLLEELKTFQQSSKSFISYSWAYGLQNGPGVQLSQEISVSFNNLLSGNILSICLFHKRHYLMKTKEPEQNCIWKEGSPFSPLPCQVNTSWTEHGASLADCPITQSKWLIRTWYSDRPCFIVIKNSSNITFRVDTFCAVRALNAEGQQGRLKLMEVGRNSLEGKQVDFTLKRWLKKRKMISSVTENDKTDNPNVIQPQITLTALCLVFARDTHILLFSQVA